MTIDFRAEVDKRKDALMEDLFGLLRINSERDDSKVDDKHPFGPGPVKALEHFLALAERDGYKTRNIDNYAGDFEFGQGDEVLGIFAHLDVVPARAMPIRWSISTFTILKRAKRSVSMSVPTGDSTSFNRNGRPTDGSVSSG